jgi:O-antigen/teichoic acid export membrane protein
MERNLVSGFISIISAKVGLLFTNLIFTAILVRLLGSAKYGEYALVLSILNVSMILINAGVNDGVRKFVAEERSVPAWADDVLGFYIRFGGVLAAGGALAFVGSNLLGITATLIGPGYEPYFCLTALVVVGRQFFSIVRSSLMGQGLESVSEPLLVLKRVVLGIVGLSLVYVGYGVSGVLAGEVVGTVLVTGVGFYFVSKQYDVRAVARISSNLPRRELVSFNSRSVVLILLTMSLLHVDIILLQQFEGNAATGYYKAALIIAELVWFVPVALQTVLLHSMSELWSRRDQSTVTELAARVTRYTLLLTLVMVMGIAALADPFIPLYYGTEFVPAITPLLLLLPGTLGFAVARPISAIGQGKGELTPLIIATGTAALLNLVLNLVLIPRFGMAGAAVATSVGYGSMLAFHGLAAFRIGFNPFADLRAVRTLSAALAAVPVIFGVTWLLDFHLVSLVVVPPLGFLVYSLVALRTRAVGPEEVVPLLRRTPSPFAGWSVRLVRRLG